jgi:glycine/D-amino acid oxidase-like deaminating enzyme
MATSEPFWLSEPAPVLPRRALDGRADVEIVGGGITGFSAALALAQAGRRVRVYEARSVASGASGRNGGFALRGGAMSYADAREWLGPEQARRFWQLTEEALARVVALGGDASSPTGSLRLGEDDENEALQAEHAALVEDGFAAEWRTAAELPAALGGRFTGAIFHPGDALVQPARLTRRLAERAAALGVEIRERQRVTSLDELDAPAVLVATDGYPSGLLGELEGLIIPTRGQMIATEPLEQRLFPVMPFYGRHGYDYWHQGADGRLIVGGFRDADMSGEFTAAEETTARIQEALDAFAESLAGFPPPVANRWSGIFGLVPDLMPVVGRVPGSDRLWVAGGYSGHGNVLGFACGELVAHAILGVDAEPLLTPLLAPARLVE